MRPAVKGVWHCLWGLLYGPSQGGELGKLCAYSLGQALKGKKKASMPKFVWLKDDFALLQVDGILSFRDSFTSKHSLYGSFQCKTCVVPSSI